MSEQEVTTDVEERKEDSSLPKVHSPLSIEDSNIKTEEDMTTEVVTMNNTASEDSEYETLEEDEGSSKSSRSRRSSFSEDRDELSDINIEEEREDGDGQEENSLAKDKKLDDDEDRRNPQYIPKRGTFYEHDDRTVMDDKEEESNCIETNRQEKNEVVSEKEGKTGVGSSTGPRKGKVWTEKADRWSHDLYKEDEQAPKSTQELIETYGYDIRNEEAPPKARRRRKYGRGPNTYVRSWEDKDAYTRSTPGQRRVYHNNREEFPELGDSGRKRQEKQPQDPVKSRSPQQVQAPAPPPPQERERREREQGPRRERVAKPTVTALKEKKPPIAPVSTKPVSVSVGGEKHNPPSPAPAPSNSFPSSPPMVVGMQEHQGRGERKDVEVKVGRGRGFRGTGKARPTLEFTASRGRTGPPIIFNREPPQVQDSLKHAADMLIQDFSHVYINNNNNTNNIVEETIIPRSERRSHHGMGNGQGEPTRSKRYSTQRQRSLPENTPPPAYSPPHSISFYTQPPPANFVPGPVYNDVAPPPVTSPPMQMVAFLPPGPPPNAPAAPPYPPPTIMNYMPPPPTYPSLALQPPISGQFDDLSQAAELFQGQGGITYYSTQSQNVLPRPNPPPRVKVAIPIVPPPAHDNTASMVPLKQHGGATKPQEAT